MCYTDSLFTLSNKQRIQLSKQLNISGVVDKAINQLYDDRKIDKPTQQALFQSHYQPLKQATEEGYGKPIAKIEYGTPDYEFLKQLQINTAVFAIFKTHASIKDMAGLLKDASGNLRSKQDFKTEALKVDSKYRTQHLDVEYDAAVRQARTAAQWQKALKTKRLYPNIKYLPSLSANPRDAHRKFYGIIRPMDDPFWIVHLPIIDWGCKCRWEVTDEDVTDIPDGLPAVPAMFANNPGITGEIFDIKNSEYIKSVPPKQQPALIQQAEAHVITELLKDTPYQPFYTSKYGNKVEIHPAAFNNNDIDAVQKTARELANLKNGAKLVQILPDLHNPALRSDLLPDAKGMKNPDYRIDGKVYDLKSPTGEKPGTRTIKNLLSDALSQGEGAVLVIPDNYVEADELYNMIGNQFKQQRYKDFELYLKYNDEWQHFTQPQWLEFYKNRQKINP